MATTQNIYDTPEFFEAYAALPRQVHGLSSAPEWPALRRLLPADLRGADVLDLGCGFGWYSRWFTAEGGAASARGVDISERMLARAREMTPGSDADGADGTEGTSSITFDRADLETVELPVCAYDVVFSALALHYVSGLERLLAEVHRSLRPGGTLVFSVEHPLLTAPRGSGTGRWTTTTTRASACRRGWGPASGSSTEPRRLISTCFWRPALTSGGSRIGTRS